MNFFKYLFSLLILMGCASSGDKTPATQMDDEPSMGIEQWLTWDGNGKMPHVVLVSGDEEYRSEEALPQLAKILSDRHGFKCTVLFSQDPEKPGIADPNYSFNIPGLEQLKTADLMILFTRFRALPSEQMKYIDDYLSNGKPLIAIRTATHAFNFKDENHAYAHYGFNYKGDKTDWHLGFGKLILGETWYTHHGHHKHQSTRGIFAEGAAGHPILNGIADGAAWGPTDVYGVRMPMDGDAQSILLGQSIDRAGEYDKTDPFFGMKESDETIAVKSAKGDYNPNENMPPIVWTKSYQIPNGKTGRSVTSTIGSATDMVDEEVRRLFVNSAYYLLDLEVPEKANVDLVDTYQPSPFAFHKDEHWDKKNIVISDLK